MNKLGGQTKLPVPGKLVKHARWPTLALFETNRLLVIVNTGGGALELPGKRTGKWGAVLPANVLLSRVPEEVKSAKAPTLTEALLP